MNSRSREIPAAGEPEIPRALPDYPARSLHARIGIRRAKAQDPVELDGQTLPLILGQRVEALLDVPLDGTPVVAMTSCRVTAEGGESDECLGGRRSLVHI
jgi:hypothetical protein